MLKQLPKNIVTYIQAEKEERMATWDIFYPSIKT